MSENLKKLKEDLISGKDPVNVKFFKELRKVIDNKESVYLPCKKDKTGENISIYNDYGLKYIELYSGKPDNKDSSEVISTDINKIIDILYENKNLNGIVFDADNDKLEISRGELSDFSNRKDPRLEPRYWEPGIPKYKDDDLMTEDEIFSMGINTIVRYLIDEEYKILDIINNYRVISNILAVKDNKRYVIDVDVAISPKVPKQDKEDKDKLLKFCKENESSPLYASMSFGAADKERYEKGLALIGDEFYCKFDGIEEIK